MSRVRLVLALLVLASAPPAYASPGCTPEQGQSLIAQGRYKQAIAEFTCVIDAGPTEVEGYRGRIEAQLLLGQFTLTTPFDAAIVDDRRVAHGVTPVEPIDPDRPAYRDVLVVTFKEVRT